MSSPHSVPTVLSLTCSIVKMAVVVYTEMWSVTTSLTVGMALTRCPPSVMLSVGRGSGSVERDVAGMAVAGVAVVV